MQDPRDIDNAMLVDADLINERGIDFWIRGEHRLVDPDQLADDYFEDERDKCAFFDEQVG